MYKSTMVAVCPKNTNILNFLIYKPSLPAICYTFFFAILHMEMYNSEMNNFDKVIFCCCLDLTIFVESLLNIIYGVPLEC